MNGLLFILAHLALIPAGLGATRLPGVRGFTLASRLSIAYALGAILVTLSATWLSMFRVRWSVVTVVLPVIALNAAMLMVLRRFSAENKPMRANEASRVAAGALAVVVLAAVTHLAVTLALTRSTSIDFLFFWGVKAARFAQAGGIDAALLRWQFFSHAVPDYPPLVPVIQAICSWASDGIPWIQAPVASALWLVAAIPLVWDTARDRVASGAAAVTAFWTAALAVSLSTSYSGGNAEAPLLFFATGAAAGILRQRPALAGAMLAGMVLTKVEGTVGAILLVAGAFARDLSRRERPSISRAAALIVPPAFALGSWFLFQGQHGLQVGFRPHGPLLGIHTQHLGSILWASVANLDAGTAGLAWVLPVLGLLVTVRRNTAVELMPALVFVIGLFAFFLFEYMHDVTDPSIRISWTLPRISQPALSVLILAAGISTFSAAETNRG